MQASNIAFADKRALQINEFCAAYGLGRTKVYELINDGTLRSVVVGGRRLIPRDAADALLSPPANDQKKPPSQSGDDNGEAV